MTLISMIFTAISYRHIDALMDPQTPIIQVLEEWLLNYQATGGEGDEDEEEAREEEKRYLAELVGFVWRVSLEGLSLGSLRGWKMCWKRRVLWGRLGFWEEEI